MTEADVVEVVFLDADTNEMIGRSVLPAEQLPDSFEPDTTVQIGDSTWSVERAEPPTAARFRPARKLTLSLRRVHLVPARDILYSLPTICDLLPSVGDARHDDGRFEMLEDDWRQVEMAHADLTDVVEAQLRAIRAIYDEHTHRGEDGRAYGFDAIHVRSEPTDPLPEPVSLRRLLSLLPPTDLALSGVGFRGQAGVVPGSFAVTVAPVVLYGLADDDTVKVLGLYTEPGPASDRTAELVASLQQVMRSFDLVLVDWCRCAIVDAAALGDYLSAVLTADED